MYLVAKLFQLSILRLGLLQDGGIGIGGLPVIEEGLISGAG
jgi:hypothetical protein